MEITYKLITLVPKLNSTMDEFVEFWKGQYDYPRMEMYNDNIGLRQLDIPNLRQLYEWKNGMNLSTPKIRTFNKICEELPVINQYKQSGLDLAEFDTRFGWMSTVWKVYLLHIIDPVEYPIFDQHVYRAYSFIKTGEPAELTADGTQKYIIYKANYMPFYHEIRPACSKHSSKELDDALWTFGRFLSNYPTIIKS